MALMAIGMFVFDIDTLAYNELQKRMTWRHARNSRTGARDATQFVGIGEETLSLNGTVHSEISEGEAWLDQLREMADQGEAWPLVSAYGVVFGSYVIEGLDQRQANFYPDGTPISIDFGIDLLRVDDPVPAS